MGWLTEFFRGRTGSLDRTSNAAARAVILATRSSDITAPSTRSVSDQWISESDAISLHDVYRAIDIIATAAVQLSIDVERNGQVLPDSQRPNLIKYPSVFMDQADFIEQNVLSLVVSGNAYWRKQYGPNLEVVNLDLLNPHEVWVEWDREKNHLVYHYRGEKIPGDQIQHITRMKLPGAVKGLGPIQAARQELAGAAMTRRFASEWFDGSGQPSGILSSDQPLAGEEAKQYRDVWNGIDSETGQAIDQTANPSGIKVLGKGLSYDPILLSPKDAQWIEAQQFDTTKIARLFGIPAYLMLAAVEGSSMTYSNVEQAWQDFIRTTLMGYLRKIELALTSLVPRGQTVRFNVETLLRSDTKSRYEAHNLSLGRWKTVDEVRKDENMAPLTDKQREELKAAQPPPAPAPVETEQ